MQDIYTTFNGFTNTIDTDDLEPKNPLDTDVFCELLTEGTLPPGVYPDPKDHEACCIVRLYGQGYVLIKQYIDKVKVFIDKYAHAFFSVKTQYTPEELLVLFASGKKIEI